MDQIFWIFCQENNLLPSVESRFFTQKTSQNYDPFLGILRVGQFQQSADWHQQARWTWHALNSHTTTTGAWASTGPWSVARMLTLCGCNRRGYPDVGLLGLINVWAHIWKKPRGCAWQLLLKRNSIWSHTVMCSELLKVDSVANGKISIWISAINATPDVHLANKIQVSQWPSG